MPSAKIKTGAAHVKRTLRDFYIGMLYRSGLWRGPVPHVAKRRVIRRWARAFKVRSFVETGTYMGDMIAAMRPEFDRL
jgi:hypothetical protein